MKTLVLTDTQWATLGVSVLADIRRMEARREVVFSSALTPEELRNVCLDYYDSELARLREIQRLIDRAAL